MEGENLKYCVEVVNNFINDENKKIKEYWNNKDLNIKKDILYHKQIKARIKGTIFNKRGRL